MSAAVAPVIRAVCLASCAASIIMAAPGVAAERFAEASVEGRYSGSFSGFLTQIDGMPLPLPVPTSTLVFMKADGGGDLTDVRITYNLGGCVIVVLRGKGSYDVASTGLGTATVMLEEKDTSLSGACDPASLVGNPIDTDEYVLGFAVNQSVPGPDQVLDVVAFESVSNPGTPAEEFVALTGNGTLRRQER